MLLIEKSVFDGLYLLSLSAVGMLPRRNTKVKFSTMS